MAYFSQCKPAPTLTNLYKIKYTPRLYIRPALSQASFKADSTLLGAELDIVPPEVP